MFQANDLKPCLIWLSIQGKVSLICLCCCCCFSFLLVPSTPPTNWSLTLQALGHQPFRFAQRHLCHPTGRGGAAARAGAVGCGRRCGDGANKWEGCLILLMEEILHQLIWRIYHYLQGFTYLRWCRISSSNSSGFKWSRDSVVEKDDDDDDDDDEENDAKNLVMNFSRLQSWASLELRGFNVFCSVRTWTSSPQAFTINASSVGRSVQSARQQGRWSAWNVRWMCGRWECQLPWSRSQTNKGK